MPARDNDSPRGILEKVLAVKSSGKLADWTALIGTDEDALKTLDKVHDKIEAGDFYTASHLFENVANGSAVYMLITTDSDDDGLEIFVSASAGGNAHFKIYQDGVVSAGTAVNIINHKRGLANRTTPVIKHTPTVGSAGPGTELYAEMLPGGRAATGSGGAIKAEAEWILESGKDYLVEVTNDSGGAIDISIGISMY